jgi:hypothetical protein
MVAKWDRCSTGNPQTRQEALSTLLVVHHSRIPTIVRPVMQGICGCNSDKIRRMFSSLIGCDGASGDPHRLEEAQSVRTEEDTSEALQEITGD